MGDDTRLPIIFRLSDNGPVSITRLTEGSKITRQAVPKHLKVLAAAGLARSLRRGRETLWQLESAALAEARGSLEQISKDWDNALQRLKDAVEYD